MHASYWHSLIFLLTAFLQGMALVTYSSGGMILIDPGFHHLSPAIYGKLFLPMIGGIWLALYVGRRLLLKKDQRFVYLGGLLVNALGMLFLAQTQLLFKHPEQLHFLLNCAFFCTGVGFGLLLAILQPYMTRYYPWTNRAMLQTIVLLFGAGMTVSALFLASMLGLGYWWLDPLLQAMMFLVLAASVWTLFPLTLPPEITLETGQESRQEMPPTEMPFKIYWVSVFLYGMCETIFGNSTTIYLHTVKGLDFGGAAAGVALFWGMVTLGRALLPYVSRSIPPAKIYVALPWIMAAALALLSLLYSTLFLFFFLAVAGLGCSAYLPLNKQLTLRAFPKSPVVTSVILLVAYLFGCGLSSYAMGALREYGGQSWNEIYGIGFILALLLALGSLGSLGVSKY